MTIRQFFTQFGISAAGSKLVQSETKTYEDSDIPVTYIRMNKSVDGQDYLVLSKNLASKVLENTSNLADSDATHTEYGWGLICHAKEVTLSESLTGLI